MRKFALRQTFLETKKRKYIFWEGIVIWGGMFCVLDHVFSVSFGVFGIYGI